MTAGSEHGDLSWQLKGRRAVSSARGVNSGAKGLRRREQSDNNTWCLAMRALSIHRRPRFIRVQHLICSVTYFTVSYWSPDVHRREFCFADHRGVRWNASFSSFIVMGRHSVATRSLIFHNYHEKCRVLRGVQLKMMMASFHFICCSNRPTNMQPLHESIDHKSLLLFAT